MCSLSCWCVIICFLFIAEKPTASITPKTPILFVNQTLTLTCSVSGDPPPTISWSKDETPLSETKKTFTKQHVQLGDEGNYSCTATNKHGNATATSNVIVDGKDGEFVVLTRDLSYSCWIIIYLLLFQKNQQLPLLLQQQPFLLVRHWHWLVQFLEILNPQSPGAKMEHHCLPLQRPSLNRMFSLVMRETTPVKPPTSMEMPLREATL